MVGSLKKLIGEEQMIQIDALPLHKKYLDVFLYTDVPEEDGKRWHERRQIGL